MAFIRSWLNRWRRPGCATCGHFAGRARECGDCRLERHW
jgi:hypothetical protein